MPPQDPLNNSDGRKPGAPGRDRPPIFAVDGGGSEHSSSRPGAECNNNNNNDDNDTIPDRFVVDRTRLEGRFGPRESQRRVIVSRGRSFLVQFSEMEGPPQIAFLMALLAIGLGSTIGVVPAVMADRFARLHHGYQGTESCGSYSSDTKPEACFLGGSDAQAAASLANLVNNTLTFLTASLMGAISDEYGRKGPLLLGLVMAMVPSLCLYLLQVHPTMNPWWYYSTSACGGLVSWMAVALSALNDVLPQEFRAPGIGLLFAGFLFGISLSPTLALCLERKTLSLVSFGVVCLGFLVTVFLVPETLRPDVGHRARRRRMEREASDDERDLGRAAEHERGEGPCPALAGFYYGSSFCRTIRRFARRPVRELSILNRNSFFRLISALAFFTGMVNSADQVLLIYYLEDQLDFDAKDVSLMFLIIGVTGIFTQVFLMKPLNDLVGEKMVVVVSFVGGTVVNILYGIAHHKSTVFAALLLGGLSNMSFPTISAIKANNVESSEQGRIQGALYSVQALASGLGPALLQVVYSKTKTATGLFGPGTMFLFAAVLFAVAVGLALALPRERANTSPRHGGRPGAAPGDGGGGAATDEETSAAAPGEYQRLAAESSSESSDDGEEDYGTI